MKKINKFQYVLFASVILMAVSTSFMQFYAREKAFGAVAPGCSTSRPTAITGTIKGYSGIYNNWSVNVMVGIDLLNSSNQKVDLNGNVTSSGYSYTDHVNPSLAPPGSASVLDQTFGAKLSDGNGVLCVSSKVKTAWFELYPKDQAGITDKTYFGGANDQNMVVKPGVTNTYALRLPSSDANGGNTGDVNGYASRNGQALNPSNLSFRIFPVNVGAACGVQGFSAGANTIGAGTTKNYYKIIHIVGGQCGVKTQQYKIIASCKNQCGVSNKTITKYVYVADGSRPRIDFSF